MSNTTDMDYCLNCTLPTKFCVGEPKKCHQKHEHYLAQLNAQQNVSKAKGATSTKNKKSTTEGY
ncbi:MAG: hypothetical protein ACI4MN_05875 [Candidatus Coproplasma sp.]